MLVQDVRLEQEAGGGLLEWFALGVTSRRVACARRPRVAFASWRVPVGLPPCPVSSLVTTHPYRSTGNPRSVTLCPVAVMRPRGFRGRRERWRCTGHHLAAMRDGGRWGQKTGCLVGVFNLHPIRK